MRKPEALTLEGHKYTFSYLTTSEATRISLTLTKYLMPSVGTMLGTMKGGLAGLKDQDLSQLGLDSALDKLSKSMDIPELMAIIQTLAGEDCVECDGNPVIFEDHYKGQLGVMLKVAKKSLEVNCGDFFDGIIGSLGSRKPKAQDTTQDPQA